MTYDALLEGYKRACKVHVFKEKGCLRKQIVGEWIVSLQRCGYGLAIYVYNADTLQEHYKKETIGSCTEDADGETKAFYKRALDRNFNEVIELVQKWRKRK